MSCIFCQIVAGESPASVVHRDELTIAFMDTMPVNPGHLLVVPIDHAVELADLPPRTPEAMMTTALLCAAGLRASPLKTDGINLFLADGAAAGQEVFHAHLHVLPRFAGDRFGLDIDYDTPPERAELDRGARLIAENLGAGAD